MKLKKNDTVMVMKGRDRGKQGVVQECLPEKSSVIVEGVNLVKKHTKPQGMRAGGIIETELPINVSNLKLVCVHCSQPVKVKSHLLPDGTRARMCKNPDCLEVIE
ncbi:MAG: 50S ribosomal protein L24 [Chloroflexi bacterium]|nr:50S ribosomal protein L24 [Chloroflexota bacterium]